MYSRILRGIRTAEQVSRTLLQKSHAHRFHSSVSSQSMMGRDKPAAASDDVKLSAHEFRIYNRMSEHMNYFWKLLYSAASSGQRPNGMSIKAFLRVGEQFVSHLTMHHNIEEQHIFPVLAKKMPAFEEELQMRSQHKEIHKGLDQLEAFLEKVNSGEQDLQYDELKRIMDTFGTVLWEHLDDEVKELGAENMRKYWSKEEMMRMPM